MATFKPGDYCLSFSRSGIVRPVGEYCKNHKEMKKDARERAHGIGEDVVILRRADLRTVFRYSPS